MFVAVLSGPHLACMGKGMTGPVGLCFVPGDVRCIGILVKQEFDERQSAGAGTL